MARDVGELLSSAHVQEKAKNRAYTYIHSIFQQDNNSLTSLVVLGKSIATSVLAL